MFHHFDVVALKRPLPDVDVPVGATGTIFRVFDRTNPPVYNISFRDANQRDLGAFRVWGDDALVLKISIWEQLKGRK